MYDLVCRPTYGSCEGRKRRQACTCLIFLLVLGARSFLQKKYLTGHAGLKLAATNTNGK